MISGRGRHLGGWHLSKPDHRDAVISFAGDLPTRYATPNELPIFDQGSVGSCVANAACSAMYDLDLRDDGSARVFSRLFVYANSRSLDRTPLSVDAGTEIRSALKSMAKWGVCLEASWPYESRWDLPPTEAARGEALNYRAMLYYHCPNLKTLRASIAQGFPVIFGFSVPEFIDDHATRTTGEIRFPAPADGFIGGHAVLAVGYDDELGIAGRRGAVLFQNSWGESWGNKGYGWLPYQYFESGLALDCWTLRRATLS